jgi:hypothetical protein
MGCVLNYNSKTCAAQNSTFAKCVGCPAHQFDMVEGGMPTWYETMPKTTVLPTVDARSYQHPITICLHGGRENNNEETHRCQHYIVSMVRTNECMYWCKDNARCDCTEK